MAKSKAATTVANKKTSQKTSARVAATGKSPGKSPGKAVQALFGFPLTTWIETLKPAESSSLSSPVNSPVSSGGATSGFVFVINGQDMAAEMAGHEVEAHDYGRAAVKEMVATHLNAWQRQAFNESKAESQFFQGALGPVWIVRGHPDSQVAHSVSALDKCQFARLRDLAGAIVNQLPSYQIDNLVLDFQGLSNDEARACLLGLELASYSYSENRPLAPKPRKKLPALSLVEREQGITDLDITQAASEALAMNIARHLTNLPGGDLNPRSYADAVRDLFAKSSSVSVEVWSEQKLVKERMGLLLAVGAAAAEGPRLVHLRYRPKVVKKQKGQKGAYSARPIALVGKGITFDSGGLDIKPSSGMRLMKKDMGGSAAVVGLMKWAEMTSYDAPLDAYLSLAENAVGSRAFRPGDVLVSRQGQTVEISNTDAEGRLVLADALDVAVSATGADRPQAVIDFATLTGAIKVGLGAEIAGLFSNHDGLARLLEESGHARGDLMWRMPLFQAYRSQLKSTFADMSNCSDGSFGGAITAALFLQSFVKDIPWAHLDIYAWKDGAGGAWSEAGGSGQAVLALTDALAQLAAEPLAE